MADLAPSWSVAEVCEQWGLSAHHLNKLIADGKVGYYTAKRSRRFFAEHVAQIRAAVEVVPKQDTDALSRIGVTRRGAARRRSA